MNNHPNQQTTLVFIKNAPSKKTFSKLLPLKRHYEELLPNKIQVLG